MDYSGDERTERISGGICKRKTSGFSDYRFDLYDLHGGCQDALCGAGQRDHWRDEYYSLLWTVYRSNSNCIAYFNGKPHSVCVFCGIYHCAPTV